MKEKHPFLHFSLIVGTPLLIVSICLTIGFYYYVISKEPELNYPGKLILYNASYQDGKFVSHGFYALQAGSKTPILLTDHLVDLTKVKGEIIAISPDKHWIVYQPGFLFDIPTEKSIPLPLPNIADPETDIKIYGTAFSPDSLHLAYFVFEPIPSAYVMDLQTGEARALFQGACAAYEMTKQNCETVAAPEWVNADTILLPHHKGLPSTYKIGSPEDPHSINYFSVFRVTGEVIQSSPVENTAYTVVNDTVFNNYNIFANTWLDVQDLLKGNFDWQPVKTKQKSVHFGAVTRTLSPDGRYILAIQSQSWEMIEVRSGKTTAVLGTTYKPDQKYSGHGIMDCSWAPDQSAVACIVVEENDETQGLYIPLSEKREKTLFTDDKEGNSWRILEWQP